jgi:hypothetical protein
MINKADLKSYLSDVPTKEALSAMQILSADKGWALVCRVLEAAAESELKKVRKFVTEERNSQGHVIRSKDQVIDFNNRSMTRAEVLKCVPQLVGDIKDLVRGI